MAVEADLLKYWRDVSADGRMNAGVEPQVCLGIALALCEEIPFLYIGEDGAVCEYNRSFADLLDLRSDLRGLSLEMALSPYPALLAALQTAVQGGKPFRSRLLHEECRNRLLNLLVDAFSVPRGGGANWLFAFRDIENLTALEGRVKGADRLATLVKVAAGIAHEIRNPLTSIRGFAQIMREDFSREELHKQLAYADLMVSELNRVEQLVSGLLHLSRAHPVQWELVAVDRLLWEMADALRENAAARGVSIRRRQRGAPPHIRADRAMLWQLFDHLTANAIEAMEDGGILTLVCEYDPAGAVVRVDVSDTGSGIPHYMMDRIFDVFYTTKDSGFGLGLPICQRIAADLGGQIRVFSKGFGATFSVSLPAVREE